MQEYIALIKKYIGQGFIDFWNSAEGCIRACQARCPPLFSARSHTSWGVLVILTTVTQHTSRVPTLIRVLTVLYCTYSDCTNVLYICRYLQMDVCTLLSCFQMSQYDASDSDTPASFSIHARRCRETYICTYIRVDPCAAPPACRSRNVEGYTRRLCTSSS